MYLAGPFAPHDLSGRWDAEGECMTRPQRKRWAKTFRLSGWDYTSPAWYFVTICTRRHIPFFGEIVGVEMIFSQPGSIVAEAWKRTEEVRPNIHLDTWTIMPNHIHGIIVIEERDAGTPHRGVATTSAVLEAGSLGAIVNQFKGVSTKRIRQVGFSDFGWQPRFYDHIIRTPSSLQRIRTYIALNPARWSEDKYHPSKIKSH
jgi:putative transposase